MHRNLFGLTAVVLVSLNMLLVGCAGKQPKTTTPKSYIQELSFPGGKFVNGRFKADPGFFFELDEKTGRAVLRRRGGGIGATIEPCECTIEGEGTCAQAHSEDEDGNILDVWCVDQDCGFCVGGITPEVGSDFVVRLKFSR